jgi:N-acetylglutamate synthase-like GNAT family acetyltransferase
MSRRHGIGSELVRQCFDRARAENLPLVVCAEPEAHPFFTAIGFQDTEHADIDLSQWASLYSGFGTFRLTGMIWSP